ncbi:retrovirus-related Pol polyprotein from transposon 297 [Trichonephila clavata]|uniref:Retrovirus-related Pol polyprotein from transposon 297 n=1 Tax=Trichonephila clavata TaxID=2740835 RepID=A0A8X6GLH2_TRICU|nr:retrovirus-related Pol polyprotein from transposon 297 [Trichonephila clavata]
MVYLGKAKKKDLFLVATELGETVSEDMRVIELKQTIIGSKNYEEEFVKNLLESIMTERTENENLEKQTLAREIQLEKEAREREFQILLQNKEIENLQLKLECLRAKQNTFVTLSQMQQFEETNYLIDTEQNSEQIELDRVEEEEVNSENKEILPPVNTYSPISHIIQIQSNTFIATQQKSEELAPIFSEEFIKTNVNACEPMPTSTEGNKEIITIRSLASKYPDAIPVPDKTSKSVIHALLQVFGRMGFPRKIYSDKGKSIMSLLTVEFFKKVSIKMSRCSIFPPQGNSMERFHRSVKRILKASCIDAAILFGVKLKERLDEEQIMKLGKVLVKFSTIFSNIPGKTNLVEHNIDLISDKRVQHKPYRMTNRQSEILKAEIERMLKYKIIEPGPSEYTSPMILVETPGRDPRPCIDYRKLNEMTRTEFYPIPNIEQRVETVAAAKFITLIDLTKGYWQIPLSPKAQKIAAFTTSFGVYRPLRMPFGLKNAPYYFSQMMSEILSGCEKYATPYLDDIAIFSETWEEHLEHFEEILNRLKKANLTIKPSKCKFAQQEVQYLGHIVDHNHLVWLKNNAGNNGRLLRWALALQSFNFTIMHKKGKDNLNVDCLSGNSLHAD